MERTMKTRQEMAAEAGVTEAQFEEVEIALYGLDPAHRAEFIKAICELKRFAEKNNITVEELIGGATKYRQ
jgi:hypothetical protein